MTSPSVLLSDIARHFDTILRTDEIPDYPGALNGVQVDHTGPVTRCAVAVDASLRTIDAAVESNANLLVVHHGLFWGGVQPLRGRAFERIRRLITHDVAVYSSHLPLDLHSKIGNNVLLAGELGLEPTAGFAKFQGVTIGVMGEDDMETATLASKCAAMSTREGGHLVSVGDFPGRRTRRWAICSGAGASSETLREAVAAGVDTMIVGEGPHHTAVDAPEMGVAILYAGHYATETLGVRALGEEIQRTFGIPWSFIDAPSGL